MFNTKYLTKVYFLLISLNLFCLNFASDCSASYCLTDGFKCISKDSLNICSNVCKPGYGIYDSCFNCSSILTTTTYTYSINDNSDPTECVSCSGDYIIFDTKQCVESCENLFSLGNFCYKNCLDNSQREGISNICKCKYKSYHTSYNGKQLFYCLSKDEDCPSNYKSYNFATGECSTNEDCSAEEVIKTENIGFGTIKRCSTNCLEKEYYKKSSDDKYYCVDTCDEIIYIDQNDNNKKKCITQCSEIEGSDLFKKDNKCVSLTECKFYYGEICYDSCNEAGVNIYHKFREKECIPSCRTTPDTDNIYLGDDNICYKKNDCKFVKSNKCLSSCNVGEGFYVIGDNNCYNSCSEIPDTPSANENLYWNFGTNICIRECHLNGNDKKYHKDTEKICYSSCKDIEDGSYIYQTGYSCSQTPCSDYFYSEDTGIKICTTETICISKGYTFDKNNECLKECDGYKYYESGHLTKCFTSLNDCFNSNYNYYHKNLKQCWNVMPSGYFINYADNEKFEIVDVCDKYYYEESSKNYCTENCKSKNLYFFNGEKKCVDSCQKSLSGGGTKYYYYDPRNNECIDSCLGRTNLEFAEEATSSPKPCLSQCPPDSFYFDDEKLIKSDCGTYYKDSSNPQLCVKKCKIHEKVNSNKECVNSCQQIYIKESRTEGDNYYQYDKCITESECLSSSPSKFIDIKKKECINSCSDTNYYIVDNLCYPKCSGIYNMININTYECLSSCPSGFTKLQKISSEPDIFLCKSDCSDGEYIYNGKCVSLTECPENSYIGNNNVCYPSCESNSNGDYYYVFRESSPKIYKCVSSCINDYGTFYYKASNPKECLGQCAGEFNFYVDGKNECLNKCPDEYPFYLISEVPHKCTSTIPSSCTGTNEYFLNGQCVEKSDCKNNGKKINSQKICLDKCKEGEIKKKDSDDTFECIRISDCIYFIHRDEEDELECIDKCPKGYNYIGNDNKCKRYCENDDGLNYYKIDSDGTIGGSDYYEIFRCTNGCNNPYILKVEGLPQCYDSCPEEYPYKSSDENRCYENCLNSLHPFTLPSPDNICADECNTATSNKYYGENKICSDSCGDKLYDGLKCVSECDLNSINKFKDGNKCVSHCSGDNGLKYSISNYVCKNKCIPPENIVDGDICRNTCGDGEFYEKITEEIMVDGVNQITETGEFKCVPNCGNNGLHYKNSNICLSECNGNDKVIENTNICVHDCSDYEETGGIYYFYETTGSGDTFSTRNICVKNCPSTKSFVDENKCADECPQERNYYINDEFVSENFPKKCLTDCISPYHYYKKINDGTNYYYECQPDCLEYYVPNLDPEKIGKFCTSCPDSDSSPVYKYKIEDANDKKCYESCPGDKPYHKEADGSSCEINCPEEAEFHAENSYICITISECETSYNYIHYDSKICSNTICSPSELKTIYHTKIICSSQCIPAYGTYLTPYQTCVQNCETEEGKFLKNDITNKKCICKGLYYFNELDGKMECLSDEILSCESTSYKIKMFETNECTNICNNNRILSPSEDICYPETYNCSENTHIINKNDIRKCECTYKFYKDDNNKIYCLNENDVCPEGYEKYIPDTMECIKTSEPCPNELYIFSFKNLCLKKCPKGSSKSGNSCQCDDKFWHEISKGNYECLEGFCLDSYPVYAPETKQCLKKCKGSYFPYLYDNKCYKDCSDARDSNINAHNAVRYQISSDIAEYECKCQYFWFYDEENNNKMICLEFNINCESQNFNFIIKKTSQCVNGCPYNYPYSFNNECFTSCENEAKAKFGLNLKTVESSYECQCENLWHYIDTGKTKKKCIDNQQCFLYDEILQYKIERTKECIDDCPHELFRFNNICYDICPDGTKDVIDNENGNSCICDKELGLWYKYNIYGFTYYKCGLDECPKNQINIDGSNYMRNNLLKNEKKCVQSCLNESDDPDNIYKYALRNICIKECPSKTKPVEEGVDDTCLFYDDLDDPELSDLEKLKEAINVQAKELYEESNNLGGFLLNKYDASLQIYKIDKSNSYKDLSMKSDLSYIDLGTCTEKIFLDNNLSDDDGIIVAKYDLLKKNEGNDNGNSGTSSGDGTGTGTGAGTGDGSGTASSQSDKNLINPVEYEFFSSKTNKKIDGSICDPYEILISYPIAYNKNRYDNYIQGKNKNEYKKKFDIGKELHNKNKDIDTFNSNSSVYKDICLGVEIDGKDLVLEDRYKYLYPNNAPLCESNCTISYTDFELERMVCACTYKEEFDFNRVDQNKNDLLNDPNFNEPKQSGANAEIIKCLSKLSIKDNEAFYYCAAITAVEISMVFVSAFYGIKAVSSNITSLLNKNILNNNLDIKPRKIKNENIAKSNRPISNPPKKYNINDNESEDKKGNIINKKNIELVYNNSILESEDKSISQDENDNRLTERKNLNKNNDLINIFDNSKNKNSKAEFIPSEFNFKYFKLTDKGVKKKIGRNNIPFKVNPNTKYLLEKRKDVEYDDNYLNGPFMANQNYLEIVDIDRNNENKVVKYIRNEKLLKTNISNNFNNKINKSENSSNENFEADLQNKIPKNKIMVFDNNFMVPNEEKNFIKIRKISPNKKKENKLVIEDYNQNEKYNNDDNVGLFTLVKREQTYLRLPYERYLSKNHNNILSIFIAEILDKIYFIKICIFLKKFEIFAIHLSLYLFCHLLLVSILCGFFTIKTIKKIWEQTNFPDINFYLLYGFIANVIVWMIYKIFLIVLDDQDKIKELIRMKGDTKKTEEENSNEGINEEQLKESYNNLIKQIKVKIIIFYVIVFVITIICFLYLVSFFGIYTGTKSKVLEAYYISIIEIILIKIVYGICLASLRIASEGNELKCLYKLVYILDKYIS